LTLSIKVGNALACLRAMPADSVHCCVTSPPYWGLRDYGTPAQVWGGDPDCRHRWTAQTRIIDNNNGNGSTTAKLAFNTRSRYARVETGFCQRCSAWRGSLGLEPDYRLYVDHLVAVLREVRRVLRHDGTLWLVIGDSYAANGAPGLNVSRSHGSCGSPTLPGPMPSSRCGSFRGEGLRSDRPSP
jgi:DNA modification methylase